MSVLNRYLLGVKAWAIGPKLRGQIFRQALPTSSQGSLPASSEVKDPTEVFTVECCLCSKYSVNES